MNTTDRTGRIFLIAVALFAIVIAGAAWAEPPPVLEPMGDVECTVGIASRGLAILDGLLIVPMQCDDGIVAFNVADPDNPHEIARLTGERVGWPEDLVAIRLAGSNGAKARVQTNAPDGPAGFQRTYRTEPRNDPALWRGDGVLLASATPQGVRLHGLDIDRLDDPTTLSAYQYPLVQLGDKVVNVATDGDLIYAATPHRFHVIDVSNPMTPHVIGQLDLEDGHSIYGMDVAGTTAVVQIDEVEGIGGVGRMQTLDLSVPRAPRLLATRMTEGRGCGMAGAVHIVDSLAYVAGVGNGVVIWDVSDPWKPNQVGVIDTGCASSVFVDGRIALVTSINRFELIPVDVFNPRAPVLLDGTPITHPLSVICEDSMAYVTGAQGVGVYDIHEWWGSGQVRPETEVGDGPIFQERDH